MEQKRRRKDNMVEHSNENTVAVIVKTVSLEESQKMGSFNRKFVFRITAEDKDDYLVALALPNSICVLVAPTTLRPSSISFPEEVSSSISGKRKKGAKVIFVGTPLMICHYADGSSKAYRSPITGQLLELNEKLFLELEAVVLNPEVEEGYIAVIFPSSKIQDGEKSSKNDNICYAWAKGECSRGNKCRFVHSKTEAHHTNLHDDTNVLDDNGARAYTKDE